MIFVCVVCGVGDADRGERSSVTARLHDGRGGQMSSRQDDW